MTSVFESPSVSLSISPLVISTDGSALGNPGPTGWCWYVNDQNWLSGGFPHGTNNLGELTAVQRALVATAGIERPIVLECDSKYAISAVTQWSHNWRRNGWVTSSGSPVANKELIEATLDLLVGRNVSFVWVRGHSGHPRNEAADARARDAASRARGGTGIIIGPGLRSI
jgi:ribonuclease HI